MYIGFNIDLIAPSRITCQRYKVPGRVLSIK